MLARSNAKPVIAFADRALGSWRSIDPGWVSACRRDGLAFEDLARAGNQDLEEADRKRADQPVQQHTALIVIHGDAAIPLIGIGQRAARDRGH
jgi:hypothetical protein